MRKHTLTVSALLLLSLTGCAPSAAPSPAPDTSCPHGICAPASPADEAAAWQVWDQSQGARSLRMDPSRPFRVEYVGHALDYPRSLADNEAAVVGKDFRWYVFRAAYLD